MKKKIGIFFSLQSHYSHKFSKWLYPLSLFTPCKALNITLEIFFHLKPDGLFKLRTTCLTDLGYQPKITAPSGTLPPILLQL